MAMTNARRKAMVLGLGATAGIAWLSWAWSPAPVADESMSDDTGEAAAPPVVVGRAAPQTLPVKQAPEPANSQAHAASEPSEPDIAAPLPQPPERIPTPHPMSLDQSKPPEQYGALSELKQQYASESRSSTSSATESKLRAMVSTRNIPSELVQDIACRRSLCKIETRWTPQRRIGFAVVLESFKQLYSQRVAVEPAAARSDDGSYLTTLYLRLIP